MGQKTDSSVPHRLKKIPSSSGIRDDLLHHNPSESAPLHDAVRRNDSKAFARIVLERNISINQETSNEETCLHLACKKGFVNMIEKIVEKGGDLSHQDQDGHTPLHDLLQQVYLEGGGGTEECKKFRTVWGKIVEVAVTWWCYHMGIKGLPKKDSPAYFELRRDALYFLRSCVDNKDGLSVLQYGAELGMVDCVNVMLTEEDVFVTRADQTNVKFEYEIEVTNLCPEYKAEIKYKNNMYFGQEEDSAITNKDIIQKIATKTSRELEKGSSSTLVETLSVVEPPLKSTPILQGIPLRKLTSWQWNVYQFFSVAWLILHSIIMILGTIFAELELKSSVLVENGTTSGILTPSTDHRAFDLFVGIYASLIFLCAAGILIGKVVKRIRNKILTSAQQRQHKQPDQKKSCFHGLFSFYFLDDTKDMGILNYITRLLEILSDQIQAIIPLVYAACSLAILAQGNNVNHYRYAWLKGVGLLFGWLVILVPARTYSPIYNFISTLKVIFLEDIIPFMLFFFTITFAFACAIQLQFRLLQNVHLHHLTTGSLEGHPVFNSSWEVAFQLVVFTVGMDTDLKHMQGVAELFKDHHVGNYWVRALLIGYGVVSALILLNMLIAMMGTTLTNVTGTKGTGWRQHQVRGVWLVPGRPVFPAPYSSQAPSKERTTNAH